MASKIENQRHLYERVYLSTKRFERITEWLVQERQAELEKASLASDLSHKAEHDRLKWLKEDREVQAEKFQLPRNEGEIFEIKFDAAAFTSVINQASENLSAQVEDAWRNGSISDHFVEELKAALSQAVGQDNPAEFMQELALSHQALERVLAHPEDQRAKKLSACFTPDLAPEFADTVDEIAKKILGELGARQHAMPELSLYFKMQNHYFDTMSRGIAKAGDYRKEYVADTVHMSQHGLTMNFAKEYCSDLMSQYQNNLGMGHSALNDPMRSLDALLRSPSALFNRPVPGCGRPLNEKELRERERSYKQI